MKPMVCYWFQASAGNKMPDKPQITFDSGLKCGTSATGWQMGGHPTKAGKVVSRKVSFSLEKILWEPKKCKGYPLHYEQSWFK